MNDETAFRAALEGLVKATRMARVVNNPKAAMAVQLFADRLVASTVDTVDRLEAENAALRARLGESTGPEVPPV
jgi:hypothetical protein